MSVQIKKKAKKEKVLSNQEIGKLRDRYLLPSTMTYFKKPVQITRGSMQYVYDEKGRQYLDAFSAVVTISVGHCHPDIVPKVQKQVGALQHMTTLYYHPVIAKYAQKMASVAPKDLDISFFTNSGCEANELAALLAKNYTGNQEFIALRHSFHGRTLMAMTLTGQSVWRHSLPYVFGVTHAPVPNNYWHRFSSQSECDNWCAAEVEQIIKYNTSGKIAGFIAEPIQGFGGVTVPGPKYFKKVYDIVKSYGGLFIADEVQTGFCRTGEHFFGISHWGVKPDIITMAKGIGNGVPLGGVITTRKIAESMRGKTHFNTYGGNPVSMTQGLAVLEVLEKYKMAANAKRTGNRIMNGLRRLQKKHSIIGDVRGKGLMIGAELVTDRKKRTPAAKEMIEIMERCKDRGVLIGKGGMAGNVIRIKPPLCINNKDCDLILDTLDEVFKGL